MGLPKSAGGLTSSPEGDAPPHYHRVPRACQGPLRAHGSAGLEHPDRSCHRQRPASRGRTARCRSAVTSSTLASFTVPGLGGPSHDGTSGPTGIRAQSRAGWHVDDLGGHSRCAGRYQPGGRCARDILPGRRRRDARECLVVLADTIRTGGRRRPHRVSVHRQPTPRRDLGDGGANRNEGRRQALPGRLRPRRHECADQDGRPGSASRSGRGSAAPLRPAASHCAGQTIPTPLKRAPARSHTRQAGRRARTRARGPHARRDPRRRGAGRAATPVGQEDAVGPIRTPEAGPPVLLAVVVVPFTRCSA